MTDLFIALVEVLLRLFKGVWGIATFNLSMRLLPHKRASSVYVATAATFVGAVAALVGDPSSTVIMAGVILYVIVVSGRFAPGTSTHAERAAPVTSSSSVTSAYIFVMLWAVRELIWIGILISRPALTAGLWACWVLWASTVVVIYFRRIGCHHLVRDVSTARLASTTGAARRTPRSCE